MHMFQVVMCKCTLMTKVILKACFSGQLIFKAYPDLTLIATYKLLHLGFPIFPILLEDSNGKVKYQLCVYWPMRMQQYQVDA